MSLDMYFITITWTFLTNRLQKHVRKSPHNHDAVYVGMIFKSREAFKQYIDFYAIREKFR